MEFGGYVRIKIIVILISLFVFIAICNSSNQEDPMEARKERLNEYSLPKDIEELVFSFPNKDLVQKDIYLYEARYISGDLSGKILISDSRANKVFIFNSSGIFINSIGETGKGPGEFNNLFRTLLFNERIVVHDNGNRRIQYFDSSGNFINSFKLHKTYLDIKFSEDGKIFANPIHEGRSKLINVLSDEGEPLYSFGKSLKFETGFSQLTENMY